METNRMTIPTFSALSIKSDTIMLGLLNKKVEVNLISINSVFVVVVVVVDAHSWNNISDENIEG